MQENQVLWEEILGSKEWGKYPTEELIRFVAKNFYSKNRSEISFLELGVGGGANLWYLAREGFCVNGIEWSESGCKQTQAYLSKEGLLEKMEYLLCGDYYDKLDEIQDESLDAWIDSASLMCNDFDKTKQIIEKACKKLKHGGKFLSITAKPDTFGFYEDASLGYHLCKPTEGWYANTGAIRYTSYQDIQKLYSHSNQYMVCNVYEKTIENKDGKMLSLFVIEGERC